MYRYRIVNNDINHKFTVMASLVGSLAVFGCNSSSIHHSPASVQTASEEKSNDATPEVSPSESTPEQTAQQGNGAASENKSNDQQAPGGAAPDAPANPTATAPAKPAPKEFPKVGVKNFTQINATMSYLTGVPRATVKTAFDTQISASLPSDNDPSGYVGSNQVATFKLAVEYCDALVKDTTNRGKIFGTFNFAALPSAAFTDAGKKSLAEGLLTAFWGTGRSTLPPQEGNVTTLVQLQTDLLSTKTLTTAAVTPAVATAVCAAALASAPVMTY